MAGGPPVAGPGVMNSTGAPPDRNVTVCGSCAPGSIFQVTDWPAWMVTFLGTKCRLSALPWPTTPAHTGWAAAALIPASLATTDCTYSGISVSATAATCSGVIGRAPLACTVTVPTMAGCTTQT